MRMMSVTAVLCCLAVAGSAQPPADAPGAATPGIRPPALDADAPARLPGLENIVAYAPGLYSGAAPEGLAAFGTLCSLGVKTIISVDGTAPDVAAARAAGLRYIHLPIGYNGMDERRTLEVARAVEQDRAAGSVYIHCHHGKHRAAGAAGAAAVTLGLLTSEQAGAKLKISGTSPDYSGLYQCVRVAHRATRAALDAIGDEFPEISRPAGLVKTMIEIDQTFDRLAAVEKAGWATPSDHPDLVPVAEAAHLADLFRVLGQDQRAKPDGFLARLAGASRRAQQLEDGLAQAGAAPSADFTAQLKAVGQSCKECHARYRD